MAARDRSRSPCIRLKFENMPKISHIMIHFEGCRTQDLPAPLPRRLSEMPSDPGFINITDSLIVVSSHNADAPVDGDVHVVPADGPEPSQPVATVDTLESVDSQAQSQLQSQHVSGLQTLVCQGGR